MPLEICLNKNSYIVTVIFLKLSVSRLYSFVMTSQLNLLSLAIELNVLSCSQNWDSLMMDLFIVNNGACVLLAGTKGDKFHELIRSLLCKCVQPKEGVFHIAVTIKNVLTSLRQVRC